MHDLKVVIIGAGIGGLTAGIALQQTGYEVEIYDRVKELHREYVTFVLSNYTYEVFS